MESPPPTDTLPGNEARQAAMQGDVFAEIASLAGMALPWPTFFGRVLRIIGKFFRSPYATLHVTRAADVVDDSCHFGPNDPAFWKPNLQQFLTESLAEPGVRARLLNSNRGSPCVALVASPVWDEDNRVVGAMALVCECQDREEMIRRLALLEALVRLASSTAGLARRTSAASPNTGTGAGMTSAAARALAYDTPEALAFAITNNLRNKLGCEQVALGTVKGRRIQITSISGLDHVADRSDGVTPLRAAMEECLDAGRPLTCQQKADWSAQPGAGVYRLHRQWHEAAGGDAVVSIPLRDRDRIVAVVSLRRRAEDPFTEALCEQVRTNVEPLAGAMIVLRRAHRGVLRHTIDRSRELLGIAVSRGHLRSKLVYITALAALAWFALGTANYRLTVPCRVTASELRRISTPVEGLLLEAAATQGDRVRAGDVLCRFDTRDLEQQQAELIARIAVLEHEKDRAMAENKPVEVRLAEANQRLTRTQLRIAENRLEQMTVRAPFDGVVVGGDLRKKVGARFPQGEPLFEVAPLAGWTLEIDVPESDIDDLRPDLTGTFSPSARPDERQPLRVTRIRPQAEPKDARNVYVTEAAVNLPFGWMRPAMEGTARIDMGQRRVWWIVLHRAVDYLRLNFWL